MYLLGFGLVIFSSIIEIRDNLRILVVDDDPDVLKYFIEITKQNYNDFRCRMEYN